MILLLVRDRDLGVFDSKVLSLRASGRASFDVQ